MIFFFLMIRRPPRSTQSRSSAASDVYKRQAQLRSVIETDGPTACFHAGPQTRPTSSTSFPTGFFHSLSLVLKAHRAIETRLQVVLMTKLTVLLDPAFSMTLRAGLLRHRQEPRSKVRRVVLLV
eukprot:TRINITY_DN466_c0_g1_i3.p2 TRINITY_DN466_c0_g1~~TRINITY_DN466_c0_g1_i3.p2  ORF type:complete len:124 (+),score=25.74 TRINITY_DN466_c0_g1_i3:115-486(+)